MTPHSFSPAVSLSSGEITRSLIDLRSLQETLSFLFLGCDFAAGHLVYVLCLVQPTLGALLKISLLSAAC